MTVKEKEKEIVEEPNVVELMAGASEEDVAKLADNPAFAKMIQERADAQIELARSADEIAQFSKKIVAGDEEKGLPVQVDKLEKFLLSLSPAQYKEAREIFEHIAKTGFVSLSEKGHGKVLEGTAQLSEDMKKALKMALAGGVSVDDFFEANAVELGKKSDYDLSEFVEKE